MSLQVTTCKSRLGLQRYIEQLIAHCAPPSNDKQPFRFHVLQLTRCEFNDTQ